MANKSARRRTRIIYRDRPKGEVTTALTASVTQSGNPAQWFNSITFGQFKQWLVFVAPLVFATWAFVLPYVDAQAEDLLTKKLIQIGMDPANIQTLNGGVASLGKDVDELKKAGNDTSRQLESMAQTQKLILDLLIKQQNQPLQQLVPNPSAQ